ncbi:MAG: toprim domain-containing protein, partial [Bacteroidales bacterium]|nr:toprim domain-containing protein [Bacteroidales bacterium]
IGFGGRILKKDDKTAKYLNSPESDIYHKSQVLYGLYFAKKEILTADRCFLVEGYTDVISMHQNGIENVVASSGTALTVEQIRLIKRFTKNITVLYDGDEAGIKASLRGIDLILEEGMNVKVLLLPEGEDPDSFSQKHSSSEFLKFIEENETDFIRFKTKLLAKEAENDPVKRATLITNVVRSIAVIPDGIARSVYLRECSRILDIGEDVLYLEIQKIRRNTFEEKSKKSSYSQPSYPEISQKVKKVETSEKKDSLQHEKDLIQSVLLHGNEKIIDTDGTELTVAQFIIKELDDEIEFQHPVYKIIYEEISAKISENLPFDDTVFLQNENPEISRVAADLMAVDYELSKIWKKQEVFMETNDMKLNEIIPEMLNAFKYFTVQKLIKDTLGELANVQKNNNDEEVGHYQQKYLILSELIRSLSNDLGRRVILR